MEKSQSPRFPIFSVWKKINKPLTAKELQRKVMEMECIYFSEKLIRKKIKDFCEISEICEISRKRVTYRRNLNGKEVSGYTYALAYRFEVNISDLSTKSNPIVIEQDEEQGNDIEEVVSESDIPEIRSDKLLISREVFEELKAQNELLRSKLLPLAKVLQQKEVELIERDKLAGQGVDLVNSLMVEATPIFAELEAIEVEKKEKLGWMDFAKIARSLYSIYSNGGFTNIISLAPKSKAFIDSFKELYGENAAPIHQSKQLPNVESK